MKITLVLIGIFVLCSSTMSFVHADNWFLFETKKCQINFPEKPTVQHLTVTTANGDVEFDNYMFEVPDSVKDDNIGYSLVEAKYPDSTINSDKKYLLDDFFRASIDGAVKNVHGKLLSEFKIQLADYPGREINIDFKDGLAVIKVRFYLVKNDLYMLQTITYTKNDFNKSIGKFMDSFKLK